MDKASAYEAGDCGFESRRGLFLFIFAPHPTRPTNTTARSRCVFVYIYVYALPPSRPPKSIQAHPSPPACSSLSSLLRRGSRARQQRPPSRDIVLVDMLHSSYALIAKPPSTLPPRRSVLVVRWCLVWEPRASPSSPGGTNDCPRPVRVVICFVSFRFVSTKLTWAACLHERFVVNVGSRLLYLMGGSVFGLWTVMYVGSEWAYI